MKYSMCIKLYKPWNHLCAEEFKGVKYSHLFFGSKDRLSFILYNVENIDKELNVIFDVLGSNNIVIDFLGISLIKKSPSDWNPRILDREGIIGSRINFIDYIELMNPPEHYDYYSPINHSGYIRKEFFPMLNRIPKKLTAEADSEQLFCLKVKEFLLKNGSEFESGPV